MCGKQKSVGGFTQISGRPIVSEDKSENAMPWELIQSVAFLIFSVSMAVITFFLWRLTERLIDIVSTMDTDFGQDSSSDT